jgi:hypothetical protein
MPNIFLQIGWVAAALLCFGRTIGLACGGFALSKADCFGRLLHDTSRIFVSPNLENPHLKASQFRSFIVEFEIQKTRKHHNRENTKTSRQDGGTRCHFRQPWHGVPRYPGC